MLEHWTRQSRQEVRDEAEKALAQKGPEEAYGVPKLIIVSHTEQKSTQTGASVECPPQRTPVGAGVTEAE